MRTAIEIVNPCIVPIKQVYDTVIVKSQGGRDTKNIPGFHTIESQLHDK